MNDSIPAPFWVFWAACLWLALFLACFAPSRDGGSLRFEELLDGIFLVDFSDRSGRVAPTDSAAAATEEPEAWVAQWAELASAEPLHRHHRGTWDLESPH